MPPELGALIEPLSVGYHAARRGRIEEGDSVLVLGGGPIGQACVLGAIREGARTVVVSEPSASRRRLNEQLGAHSVDPTATSDVAESTIALIGDRPDVILDAVGTTATLADAFACSSSASLIVLVGMGAKTVELPAFEISTKERSVVGSFCYSKSEFRETAHWVSTVPPELGLLIDARVDLMTAPSTFAQLARGELDASKVLVLPNSSLFAPMPAGAVANP
jgi:threonine dehydrogenase-like Zn-dependent dehydrogenase